MNILGQQDVIVILGFLLYQSNNNLNIKYESMIVTHIIEFL